MIWATMFSQTGTEICDLADMLGRKPDIIITNAPEEKINPRVYLLGVEVRRIAWKPTAEQYFAAIPKDLDTLITLHGWLRIILPEVCEAFPGQILNGHPALISKYPELRGKDPQVRAFDGSYEIGGSTVHVVTPIVDAGPILAERQTDIKGKTLDEVYLALRMTSLESWKDILREKLCLGCCD